MIHRALLDLMKIALRNSVTRCSMSPHSIAWSRFYSFAVDLDGSQPRHEWKGKQTKYKYCNCNQLARHFYLANCHLSYILYISCHDCHIFLAFILPQPNKCGWERCNRFAFHAVIIIRVQWTIINLRMACVASERDNKSICWRNLTGCARVCVGLLLTLGIWLW